MKTETRIKVLAKCYVKARRNASDALDGLADDIGKQLREFEETADDAAYEKLREDLDAIGFYER